MYSVSSYHLPSKSLLQTCVHSERLIFIELSEIAVAQHSQNVQFILVLFGHSKDTPQFQKCIAKKMQHVAVFLASAKATFVNSFVRIENFVIALVDLALVERNGMIKLILITLIPLRIALKKTVIEWFEIGILFKRTISYLMKKANYATLDAV